MRIRISTIFAPRSFAPLLAGLLAATGVSAVEAPAKPRPLYVIADGDGYGLVDCVLERRECGKFVADSWCEAHGHRAAVAFGPAEDVTATIKDAAPQKATADAAVVACAD